MIVSFAFWNLRGKHAKSLAKRRPAILRCLTQVAASGVNVCVFAECPFNAGEVVKALDAGANGAFYEVPSECSRIMVFSNLVSASWEERYADDLRDRFTVHEFQCDPLPGVLLVSAHLEAPPLAAAGRAERARQVADSIRRVETDVGHTRTVLVGDLNMNPFDDGLVQTTALHALMTRSLVRSAPKMKSRAGLTAFYNPMWSFLGDWRVGDGSASTTASPGGTYYRGDGADLASHFWHVYDQVLLRSDLMDRLVGLEVPNVLGDERLVTKHGRPRIATFSDHLPLLFTIDLR